MGDQVRIDKWLWAARFFRTRSLARAAIQGGKVRLNGSRVKPGRALKMGDLLDITRGEEQFQISVDLVTERRGPASHAVTLYTESPESIARREDLSAQRALQRSERNQRERRPDKRERRRLIRFRKDLDSE